MLQGLICLFFAFILTVSCSTVSAAQVSLELAKDINQDFKVDFSGNGRLVDANIKFIDEAEAAAYILTLYNNGEIVEFKLPPGSGVLKVVNPFGEKKENIIYVINDAKKKAISDVQVIGLKDGVIGHLLDPGVKKIVGKNGRISDDLLGTSLLYETELPIDESSKLPLQKWTTAIQRDYRTGLYSFAKPEKLMYVHIQPARQFQINGWIGN